MNAFASAEADRDSMSAATRSMTIIDLNRQE